MGIINQSLLNDPFIFIACRWSLFGILRLLAEQPTFVLGMTNLCGHYAKNLLDPLFILKLWLF